MVYLEHPHNGWDRYENRRSDVRKVAALTILTFCLVASPPAWAEKVVQIESRPGVTQRVIMIEVDKPLANIILFVGGAGRLRTDNGQIAKKQTNFVARTRGLYAAAGFNVAIPDAPSDIRDLKEGLRGQRWRPEYAEDIAAVIDYMKGLSSPQLSVWLVGTSRGTVGAIFAAAAWTKPKPDGLVLTASVTRPRRGGRIGGYLLDQEGIRQLESIRVPTLVVHHKDDGCYVTPAGDVEPVVRHLKVNTPKVESLIFEGGEKPETDACRPLSEHGFFGIEEKVVTAITDWIKANLR